jgi:hypothetical protein
MSVDTLDLEATGSKASLEKLQGLYKQPSAANTSVIVVPKAPFILGKSEGKLTMNFPWIDELGLYAPDRNTELGGVVYLPDMPPHIDPHPEDSLKVSVLRSGNAIVRFVANAPRGVLDETNELPDSDYTLLEGYGAAVDEVALRPGDAVCFLGSTTLHEFVSVGPRESYINSYRPVITELT